MGLLLLVFRLQLAEPSRLCAATQGNHGWIRAYPCKLIRVYPHEDICIIYVEKFDTRNVMLVWGYGWQGTYAGSTFMGDPANWEEYEGAHLLFLRWKDYNRDGLVQMGEIIVELSV